MFWFLVLQLAMREKACKAIWVKAGSSMGHCCFYSMVRTQFLVTPNCKGVELGLAMTSF